MTPSLLGSRSPPAQVALVNGLEFGPGPPSTALLGERLQAGRYAA